MFVCSVNKLSNFLVNIPLYEVCMQFNRPEFSDIINSTTILTRKTNRHCLFLCIPLLIVYLKNYLEKHEAAFTLKQWHVTFFAIMCLNKSEREMHLKWLFYQLKTTTKFGVPRMHLKLFKLQSETQCGIADKMEESHGDEKVRIR